MYLDSKKVFFFTPKGLSLIAKIKLVGQVGCCWGRIIAGDWVVSEVSRSSLGDKLRAIHVKREGSKF